MATQKQIEKLTKDYTTGLAALIREQVLEETKDKMVGFFMNGVTPKKARRKKAARKVVTTRKNGKQKVGAKRSPKALEKLQARIFDAIKKYPGETSEKLAKRLRIKRTKDMSLPLRKLVDAKQIRKTGERRSTKYYPKIKRK